MPIRVGDLQSVLHALKHTPLGQIDTPGQLNVEVGSDLLLRPGVLKGDAAFTITLFAASAGEPDDEDGVVGTPRAGNGLGLGAQVAFDPAHAWLKYRWSGAAAGGFGDAVGIDTSLDLVFADYHRHAPAETLDAAADADLHRVRGALWLDDVRALAPGDAVLFQFAGELGANVSMSWADLLGPEMRQLAGIVGGLAGVRVTMKLGASVSASVNVQDDFLVAFSRADDGRVRVAVRRAKTRGAKAGAALGVTVHADLGEILGPVQEAIESTYAVVDGVLAKGTFDDLDPREKRLVRALLDRIGTVGDRVDQLEDLRHRLAAMHANLAGRIAEAINNRLRFGFATEVRATEQDASVFQAVLDDAMLGELHESLSRGQLGPALEIARRTYVAPSGLQLERFLRQEKSAEVRGWGWTLGPWSAGDSDAMAPVRQWDVQDRVRVSWDCARKYSVNDEVVFCGAFRAATSKFAPRPTADDLALSIALSQRLATGLLSRETAEEWLDAAAAWNVVLDGEIARVAALALPGFENRKCEGHLELRFEDDVFEHVLDGFRALSDDDLRLRMAHALARAVPQNRVQMPHLLTPSTREAVFAPVFDAFLGPLPAGAQGAADHVDGVADALVPNVDGIDAFERGRIVATAKELVRLNEGTREAWFAFRDGMRELARMRSAQEPLALDDHDQVRATWQRIRGLFSQSWSNRACGALLLTMTSEHGDDVSGSLRIEADGGPEIQVIG